MAVKCYLPGRNKQNRRLRIVVCWCLPAFIYSQGKVREGKGWGAEERGGVEGERRKTKENMVLYYVFLIIKKTVEVTNKLLSTHTNKYTKKTGI